MYAAGYSDSFLSLLGVVPPAGYVGPLFDISWADSAPLGLSANGSFDLNVGPPGSPDVLSSSFTAAVTGVPEPDTLSFVILGATMFGLSRVRQIRLLLGRSSDTWILLRRRREPCGAGKDYFYAGTSR